MRIALLTTFPSSRKEPLATMLERIHAAFLAAFGEEPGVRFLFSDSPVPGSVSSVDRVLKRHPQLQRFVSSAPTLPGNPPVRQISNGPNSPIPGEPIEFSLLLAVAKGVPRSFPLHQVSVHLHNPAFTIGIVGVWRPLAMFVHSNSASA